MAIVNLSPVLNAWQGLLPNGAVNAGGWINVYTAGTSTPAISYTDSSGLVPTSNPIPLNASGVPPYEIWLIQGSSYKFVVTDASLNVLFTLDNIIGVNDIGSSLTHIGANLLPTINSTYTLGSAGLKWLSVYITTVYGSAWQGNLALTGNQTTTGSSTITGGVIFGTGGTTLNWYQEGTFTPTVTFGGAAVGVVYGTQKGFYTRIGNRVLFSLSLIISNLGSSVGSAVVNGLPFALNIAYDNTVFRAGMFGSGAGLPFAAQMFGSQTALNIVNNTTGAALTQADFNTAWELSINGQYAA